MTKGRCVVHEAADNLPPALARESEERDAKEFPSVHPQICHRDTEFYHSALPI